MRRDILPSVSAGGFGRLAQLARASGLHPEGPQFESGIVHFRWSRLKHEQRTRHYSDYQPDRSSVAEQATDNRRVEGSNPSGRIPNTQLNTWPLSSAARALP